jgi:hypothetical protein
MSDASANSVSTTTKPTTCMPPRTMGHQSQRLPKPKPKSKGHQTQKLPKPKATKAKSYQNQRLPNPQSSQSKGHQSQRPTKPKPPRPETKGTVTKEKRRSPILHPHHHENLYERYLCISPIAPINCLRPILSVTPPPTTPDPPSPQNYPATHRYAVTVTALALVCYQCILASLQK